jgi:UDP-N-acetylglucosamine/UDP-N-acetylgalactosamine diphosphorylase
VEAVPAQPEDEPALRARGEAAIRAGEIAAFVVAGGQGTRLGYDGPKGEVPATPITQTPLFGVFGEQIRVTGDRYGVRIPWYVMCSPLNVDRTRTFFEANAYFGLDAADVHFFVQGVHPTFDATGRALLAAPDALLCNPDGHGGSLTALARSGALADMQRRGVQHLAYFQVDNPLTRIIDPVFIGLHLDPARSSAQMSSKMVAKTEPSERVGVFGCIGERFGVIEYSDLS